MEEIGFSRIDFQTLPRLDALSYVEKHYVSREFADKKSPRALMINEPCGYAVMLCEEDHLRIQCILPGLSLEEAYLNASRKRASLSP